MMDELAYRRWKKETLGNFQEIKKYLADGTDPLSDLLHYCMHEYETKAGPSWIQVLRTNSKIEPQRIEFMFQSTVGRVENPASIVTFKLNGYTVPVLTQLIDWEYVEKLKTQLLEDHGHMTHAMSIFWWAGIHWFWSNDWLVVDIVGGNVRPIAKPSIAFMSPDRQQRIIVAIDYTIATEDIEYINKVQQEDVSQ